MRWMIHGADHKTGKELTIVIDADDPRQAEQRALYNDILVSSIRRFTEASAARPMEIAPPAAPVRLLEYGVPELPPEQRPPLAPAPSYKQILSGARWLTGLAVAVRVVGVIGLVAAVGVTLVPLIGPVRLWMPFTVIPMLCFIGGGILMAMAFVCLFCGATISMLSDLALAVRDMARNSFPDERQGPASSGEPLPMAQELSPAAIPAARRAERIESERQPHSLLSLMEAEL